MKHLTLLTVLPLLILFGCQSSQSLPRPNSYPTDTFTIRYMDDAGDLKTTSSKYFGHNYETWPELRFVNAADNDYYVKTFDVKMLSVSEPITLEQENAWPDRFELSEIPKVSITLEKWDGTSETHEMWATIWFYFDGQNGEEIGVHPGRIMAVWFPEK